MKVTKSLIVAGATIALMASGFAFAHEKEMMKHEKKEHEKHEKKHEGEKGEKMMKSGEKSDANKNSSGSMNKQ